MMNKYKIWDHRTVTSPSGRHQGHFHALFKPFKFKDDADRVRTEEKHEPIIQVHFVALQIAAIHSHVYKRWTNILTCMIKKALDQQRYIGSASSICMNVT